MIGISISPFLSMLGALQHWTAYLLDADPYLVTAGSEPGAQVELILLGAPQVTTSNAIVTAGSEPGAQVALILLGAPQVTTANAIFTAGNEPGAQVIVTLTGGS